MKSKKRVITNRNSVDKLPLGSSGYTKTQKVSIRSKERMQRLSMTRAKKYLLYMLASFLLAQTVKFLIYNVLFRSESTPSGIWFLLVIYLQTGLLIMTFVFFVLAVFNTLKRLLTEEI